MRYTTVLAACVAGALAQSSTTASPGSSTSAPGAAVTAYLFDDVNSYQASVVSVNKGTTVLQMACVDPNADVCSVNGVLFTFAGTTSVGYTTSAVTDGATGTGIVACSYSATTAITCAETAIGVSGKSTFSTATSTSTSTSSISLATIAITAGAEKLTAKPNAAGRTAIIGGPIGQGYVVSALGFASFAFGLAVML